LKGNNGFASVLLFSVLACGATVIYPSTSETITTWKTIVSKTTYTSTSTSLSLSYVKTTSIITSMHTWVEDSIQTFTNYGAEIRQERAAHYSVIALVIEITLPPEIIPTDKHIAHVLKEYHYRSPKNMTIERIALGTWMDMRTSSARIYTYWPTKVNVSEGVGSLFDFDYIDRNDTKVSTVYISKEGILPEILSVDVKRVWEDAVTKSETVLRTTTLANLVIYTKAIEKTYIKTMTYRTYETYVVTSTPITTATKETLTSTTVKRTVTVTPTTPSGITISAQQIVLLCLIIGCLLVVAIVVDHVRRRRKPPLEIPWVPPRPPAPPPI